jgi:hypothetical protein
MAIHFVSLRTGLGPPTATSQKGALKSLRDGPESALKLSFIFERGVRVTAPTTRSYSCSDFGGIGTARRSFLTAESGAA